MIENAEQFAEAIDDTITAARDGGVSDEAMVEKLREILAALVDGLG